MPARKLFPTLTRRTIAVAAAAIAFAALWAVVLFYDRPTHSELATGTPPADPRPAAVAPVVAPPKAANGDP